jgi:16S rRNA (adenine1518-N6/adenine1519-N6)-dimethyltransferase
MPFYGKRALLDQLTALGVRLDKQRGQCYLIDENIIQKIIEFASLQPDRDSVLEIGPGLGILTDELIKYVKKVVLIENDRKIGQFLSQTLQKNYDTQVVDSTDLKFHTDLSNSDTYKVVFWLADALTVQFPPVTKIVSNIPYQISAPLLFKIIESWRYEKVILMVQKEFADHLTAAPNSEKYSRISAAAGLYLSIKQLYSVPHSCFYPVPKVDSVIIELTRPANLTDDSPEILYRSEYLEFLRGIFPYKNKGLKKAISFYLETDAQLIKKYPYLDDLKKLEELGQRKVRTYGAAELFRIMMLAKTGK